MHRVCGVWIKIIVSEEEDGSWVEKERILKTVDDQARRMLAGRQLSGDYVCPGSAGSEAVTTAITGLEPGVTY